MSPFDAIALYKSGQFPDPAMGNSGTDDSRDRRPRAFRKQSCFEPACGDGHIAKPLKEYFGEIRASDIHAYGYGAVADFLNAPFEAAPADWVITNPPSRLA
jgi:hypothetical protein